MLEVLSVAHCADSLLAAGGLFHIGTRRLSSMRAKTGNAERSELTGLVKASLAIEAISRFARSFRDEAHFSVVPSL